MLKVYALLIRKHTDTLQSGMYTPEYIQEYDTKQAEYANNMNKLYRRLKREYGFSREKFYALQEQSMTF